MRAWTRSITSRCAGVASRPMTPVSSSSGRPRRAAERNSPARRLTRPGSAAEASTNWVTRPVK